MSPYRIAMSAALVLAAAGCATTSSTVLTPAAGSQPQVVAPAQGEEREIIVNVAGQRAPCTGVAPTLCLQVRTQPGAAWTLHHGDIEGFTWQSGTEYVIRVREVTVANPPADAPSRRWVLQEVLESGPAL
ncbi:MAG: DUF4377 domain-containing protein [Arenimonas sp.]|uniref:DUF4377 domain-containing protein n=1 Tax=Arenimonas sp. TaxID=1872635 RepID=UPI0025B87CB2|nr:DUF4377 domain-containing protein [Arenimonas sp.]MBW8366766.1 DUF4377 domain-containing protein [Arenimonas sp.]